MVKLFTHHTAVKGVQVNSITMWLIYILYRWCMGFCRCPLVWINLADKYLHFWSMVYKHEPVLDEDAHIGMHHFTENLYY